MTLKEFTQPSKKCVRGCCGPVLIGTKTAYDKTPACCVPCVCVCIASEACMCVPLATSCAELSCACAEVATIIDCWVSPCGQFCAYNIPPEMQMTLAEKIHCGDEQSRLKKQAYLDQAKVEWFVPTSMKGGCMVAGTVICKALCMAYAETVMGPLAVACDTYAAPSHSQLTTRFLLGSPGSYPPLPPSGGRAGWRWRMTSVNGVVGQVVSRNGCPNLDRPAAGP